MRAEGCITYSWKFGDGKKGSGRRASHKYRKPGTYKVTLIVKDEGGRSARITRKLKVRR